jgi:hypothetical protein
MKFQIESEFPDVLVELNCGGRYEVSFGDFEGTDEDWTPILAEFFYKSDALEWAFKNFVGTFFEDGQFVVLDNTKEIEMLAFSINEFEDIQALIEEECINGN